MMFSHVSSSSRNPNYGQQMLLMKSKIPVRRECKRKERISHDDRRWSHVRS